MIRSRQMRHLYLQSGECDLDEIRASQIHKKKHHIHTNTEKTNTKYLKEERFHIKCITLTTTNKRRHNYTRYLVVGGAINGVARKMVRPNVFGGHGVWTDQWRRDPKPNQISCRTCFVCMPNNDAIQFTRELSMWLENLQTTIDNAQKWNDKMELYRRSSALECLSKLDPRKLLPIAGQCMWDEKWEKCICRVCDDKRNVRLGDPIVKATADPSELSNAIIPKQKKYDRLPIFVPNMFVRFANESDNSIGINGMYIWQC